MSFNLSSTTANKVKSDELKQLLTQVVTTERDQFLAKLEEFYAKDRKTDDDYLAFCHTIIAAINHVLEAGDWDDSLFLHNTVKPLVEMRAEMQELAEQLQSLGAVDQEDLSVPAVSDDAVKLYIALFQHAGHDLKKWELQLRSIQSYVLGRPVYENEDFVAQLIRAKSSPETDAYVVVALDKDAVRNDPYSPTRKDRHGNPLVALKDGVVRADNILEFVHQNKRYLFKKGTLVAR